MNAKNYERFVMRLTLEYEWLYANESDYAYSAAHITAADLATKMTNGLLTGSASKSGRGIARTTRALGIENTYTAIREFLTKPEVGMSNAANDAGEHQ